MTPKRILVLDGHPGTGSLSRLFSDSYAKAAQAAGHEVRVVHLSALAFDMDYGEGGYANPKPLEPVLQTLLDDLEWSQHLLLCAPMWWGGVPAKLKGLFDRVLVPGRTFDTRNPGFGGLPRPMLTGRTARVIVTSDTPAWYFRLAYGRPLIRQLRGQILGFIGFKPARFTWFSGASDPGDKLAGWTRTVEQLGTRGM